MSQAVIVLTTLPVDAADAFAHTLVSERFAACVNVLPAMRSTYRWQGAVETASERQVIIKTAPSRLDALKERIKSLHPYDVPELLVLSVVDGGAEYLDWVAASVDASGSP